MTEAWWHLRVLADVPVDDGWLSDDERRVLAGLHVPKRRDDWRLGRFVAKELAGAALGVDWRRMSVRPGTDGAPDALLDGGRAPLSLSISHREGHGLAVVAPVGTAIGGDLEWVEPRRPVFVEDWLGPSEQRLVATSIDRDRTVALVWAAKEAAAKVRREGLRLDVRRLTVVVDADAVGPDWQAVRIEGVEGSTTGWCRVDGRLVVAVAASPRCDPPKRAAILTRPALEPRSG